MAKLKLSGRMREVKLQEACDRALAPPKLIEVHWRWHSTRGQTRRVWRSDWPGDTFELMEPQEFIRTQKVLQAFGIAVIEQED